MPMPKCQRCRKEWSWIETIKSSFITSGKGMDCPHCKKKQHLTAKSRKRSTISMFVIISPLAFFYNVSPLIGFASLIGACLVYMGVWPYFVELTNQEKSA